MMMAQSLFITLKQTQPRCHIDVLAPLWSLGLLAKMPEVSQGLVMPLSHGQFGLLDRIRLGREFAELEYDQAIVLPNSWKSALIPFFANIALRTGFLGEGRWGLLNDVRRLDKTALPMTVQRFVALGVSKNAPWPPACPPPALRVSELARAAVIKKFALDNRKPVLVLCPGAEYGPAKRWPEAHFAEVARQQINRGFQVWLLGSTKDRAVSTEINRLADGLCLDFCGQTDLTEAVDLMSLADAVVSNDSGLMHIAAALNKKLIAIYGSSDPKFTPPLNSNAALLTANATCSPCFKRDCKLYKPDQPQYLHCLRDITPGQVVKELAG